MKSHPAYGGLIGLLLFASACIEPYDPPVSDEDVRILVVDANINGANGDAVVGLTRTVPVESTELVPAERGAFVYIRDDQDQVYNLAETGPGIYSGSVGAPDPSKKYTLFIRTGDTGEYTSDPITLLTTPPIDSVSYFPTADGLELRVNTHDATGKARYFRWAFEETYEYHTAYNSVFMWEDDEIVTRPFGESLFTCWRTNLSSRILVGSTEHLNEAAVRNFQIQFIPKGSVKLSIGYSLLVRQQALSREAYNYWLNVQKTTEQVGGLFDPLPSEVLGNIRCVSDPSEKVIGFFLGSTIQETRIFVDRTKLPRHLLSYVFNSTCMLDTVLLDELNSERGDLLVDAVYGEMGEGLLGYTVSSQECIDCTLQGGTTEKPEFWK